MRAAVPCHDVPCRACRMLPAACTRWVILQAAEAAAGVLKDSEKPPSAEKERSDELLRRAEAELRAAHANVILFS